MRGMGRAGMKSQAIEWDWACDFLSARSTSPADGRATPWPLRSLRPLR